MRYGIAPHHMPHHRKRAPAATHGIHMATFWVHTTSDRTQQLQLACALRPADCPITRVPLTEAASTMKIKRCSVHTHLTGSCPLPRPAGGGDDGVEQLDRGLHAFRFHLLQQICALIVAVAARQRLNAAVVHAWQYHGVQPCSNSIEFEDLIDTGHAIDDTGLQVTLLVHILLLIHMFYDLRMLLMIMILCCCADDCGVDAGNEGTQARQKQRTSVLSRDCGRCSATRLTHTL